MQLSLSVSSWQRRLRVLLVILIALALADLTNFSVEDWLRPASKAPEPVSTPAAGPFGLSDKDQVSAVLSTTAPRGGAKKSGQVTASTTTQATNAAPPVPAGPPPRLVGTLAGSGCHLAVLSMGNETVIAGPGKVVSGYRILSVDSWSARVRDSAGNTQVLGLELAGGTPEAQAPTLPAPPAPGAENATTGGAVNIPHAQFKDVVDHPEEWISKVQLKMERQGDEVLGARVTHGGEKNPFALVGIQSGDIIRTFNSRPLKGPDDLMWAKGELANARSFHFDILRAGAPTTLDVEIKD